MSTPLVTRYPIDAELLDRYLARLTTPAESEQVQRWVASHPDHAIVVGALQTVPLQTDGGELTTDTEAWLARVDIQTRNPETRTNHRHVSVTGVEPQTLSRSGFKAQPPRRGVWYSLAGVIVVIMTMAVGWHAGVLHRVIHTDGPVSTYVTGNGERANITLPDGNTVTLNVASRLEVPADYLAGDHTVRLRGEALFNVIQHASTPFSVVAGQTTTQVLGTSFLVRHYATDSATTVAVREGKVKVGAAVVTANRLVEVRGAGPLVSRAVTPSQFSFATGTLTLDELTLPEAMTELDRWYDADIRLGDPAMASRYVISGKFAAGSLSDLTVYLQLILDVRVVRYGRVLTLYPK